MRARCVTVRALFLFVLLLFPVTTFAQQGKGLMQHAQIGSFQTHYGPFSYARRIALDAEGGLVIADDINHRVMICDQQERCESFGVKGDQPGEFSFPEAVAVAPDGRIVVADTENHRVQVCSRRGECIAFRPQEIGNDEVIRIREPRGIAVDDYSNIWVVSPTFGFFRCSMEGECAHVDLTHATTGEHIGSGGAWDIAIDDDGIIAIVRGWSDATNPAAVVLCEPDLRCRGFGKAGLHGSPDRYDPGVFVSAQGIGFDSYGNIVVADMGNSRIQVCTRTGECWVVADDLVSPFGLALESDGSILVSGSRAGILRCTPTWVCSILMGGRAAAGYFDHPQGLAVLPDGQVLVADSVNRRIQRCGVEGSCVISHRLFPFEIYRNAYASPNSVAVAADGSIAFSDSAQGMIHVCRPGWDTCQHRSADATGDFQFVAPRGLEFESSGRVIFALDQGIILSCNPDTTDWECNQSGGDTLFNILKGGIPADIALDAQGRLILPDRRRNVVFICSKEGECTSFGSQGDALGQFDTPSAVAINTDGRILIADTNNDRVQLCDYGGVCTAFGRFGYGKGQFFRPGGIDVDSQGRIYISDTENHRVLVFDPELKPIELNLGANGAWFDPQASGQGIFLDVLETWEQAFLGWFTYENDGQSGDFQAFFADAGQRWMTAQGDLDKGVSLLQLYRSSGGVFDNQQTVTNELIGEVFFELTSCWTAELSYAFQNNDELFGQISLVRIAHDNVSLCEELDGVDAFVTESDAYLRPAMIPDQEPTPSLFNQGLSGAWYNPATSGQGFFLDVLTENRQVFLSWFTFDVSASLGRTPSDIGDPGNRWITAQGVREGNRATLMAYLTSGGKFDDPSEVTNEPYGTIELEFDSCLSGRVRYDFPDVQLSGVVPIERISDANIEACEVFSQ